MIYIRMTGMVGLLPALLFNVTLPRDIELLTLVMCCELGAKERHLGKYKENHEKGL